jgi:hypothetical protein
MILILTPLIPLSNITKRVSKIIQFERGKRVKIGGYTPYLLVSPLQPENSLVYSMKQAGEGQE